MQDKEIDKKAQHWLLENNYSNLEMTENKILATAYINLIQDSKGETQFEYGYDLDKVNVSLNDIGTFLSFLDTS